VVVLDNTMPLDESSQEAGELLPTLQGNILKFHGRTHAVHLFFAFRPEATIPERRATLRTLSGCLTSARTQLDEIDHYHATNEPAGLFGHLALSAAGYQGLGFDPATLFPEPPTTDPDELRLATTFATRMRDTAPADFGDTPNMWEAPYQEDLAGLLILAMNNPTDLTSHVDAARLTLGAACRVLAEETGHIVRAPGSNKGLEPFGFVDGRSQPIFLARDVVGPTPVTWDPFAPLGLVLIRDPVMTSDPRCHGSFLAYRKLDQNVRGFQAAVEALSTRLTPPDVDRAGALVVGRFKDGTALQVAGAPQGLQDADNDFDYISDPHGTRCPFQGHVRKVNPRGSGATIDKAGHRRRRLTRRGMVYGTEVPVVAANGPLPESGVGLLFMCYQASVRKQFAFVQTIWSHTPTFPRGDVGVDAVIGEGVRSCHRWPATWDEPDSVTFEFQAFVRVLGGEFFFAPSIPFFQQL
jgi:Dyp-type peroxidase family